MKLAVLALAVFFATPVLAAEVDPFDPASCSGRVISGTRALELLGSNASVNLAYSQKDNQLLGKGRMRQKINGAIGAWHSTYERLDAIAPYLSNNDGKLGLNFYYRRNDRNRNSIEMKCAFDSRFENFTCEVAEKDKAETKLGSGKFIATLTDNCLRLVSSESTPGRDYEWAYLLSF